MGRERSQQLLLSGAQITQEASVAHEGQIRIALRSDYVPGRSCQWPISCFRAQAKEGARVAAVSKLPARGIAPGLEGASQPGRRHHCVGKQVMDLYGAQPIGLTPATSTSDSSAAVANTPDAIAVPLRRLWC